MKQLRNNLYMPVFLKPVRRAWPVHIILAKTTANIVATQKTLDCITRQSLVDWEESGQPPSGFTLPKSEVVIPLSIRSIAKKSSDTATHFDGYMTKNNLSKLKVNIAYKAKHVTSD